MVQFFPLSLSPFGLNISDSAIKVAQLKGKRLLSLGFSLLPEGIVEGGEIKDKEKLAFFIKKAIDSSVGKKINNKFVAFSLPEEKVVTNFLSLPLMTEEELQSAVPFELEQHLPLPISEFYLDWEKIPSSLLSQRIEVVTFVVAKSIVQGYLETIKSLNLVPVIALPESLAIINLFKEEIQEKTYLVLDIGASKTTFIFVHHFFICFSFTSPLGSKVFTQNIGKSLGISFLEAENLKRKIGLKKIFGTKEISLEEKIYEALIPSLVDLAQQTKRFLAFYHDWAKKRNLPKITKIFLTGGGSNLIGIEEFFEKQLEIETEKFKIEKSILFPSFFPLSEEEKLGLVPVLGLVKTKIYD